jgi:hypothetical protein
MILEQGYIHFDISDLAKQQELQNSVSDALIKMYKNDEKGDKLRSDGSQVMIDFSNRAQFIRMKLAEYHFEVHERRDGGYVTIERFEDHRRFDLKKVWSAMTKNHVGDTSFDLEVWLKAQESLKEHRTFDEVFLVKLYSIAGNPLAVLMEVRDHEKRIFDQISPFTSFEPFFETMVKSGYQDMLSRPQETRRKHLKENQNNEITVDEAAIARKAVEESIIEQLEVAASLGCSRPNPNEQKRSALSSSDDPYDVLKHEAWDISVDQQPDAASSSHVQQSKAKDFLEYLVDHDTFKVSRSACDLKTGETTISCDLSHRMFIVVMKNSPDRFRPIIAIKAREAGSFLSKNFQSENLHSSDHSGQDALFTMELVKRHGRLDDSFTVRIQTLDEKSFLSIKNGKWTLREDAEDLFFKQSEKSDLIDGNAWLASHDTLAVRFDDRYLRLNERLSAETSFQLTDQEIFQFKIVETETDPSQVIVRILSKYFGSYLAFSDDRRAFGNSFASENELFRLGFEFSQVNDGNRQVAWIQNIVTEEYLSVHDGAVTPGSDKSMVTLEIVNQDIPVDVSKRLSQHDYYAIYAPECYLCFNNDGKIVRSSTCGTCEVLHVAVIDDTIASEPVISIQSQKFAIYLQETPDTATSARAILDDQGLFRMAFLGHSENDYRQQKVKVRSILTGKYLAFQDNRVKFTKEPMALTLEKLQAKPSFDTLARLSKHATFCVKLSHVFLRIDQDGLVSAVQKRPGADEIFDVVVVDGSSSTEPVVALRSRLFGNYLRVTPERQLTVQTFIGFEEQFVLAVTGIAGYGQNIGHKAYIRHIETNSYLAIDDGQVVVKDEMAIAELFPADSESPINVLARLSQHDTFFIELPGGFLSISDEENAWVAQRPESWERFTLRLIDMANMYEPIVKIESRHFGSYLAVGTDGRIFVTQSTADPEALFKIGFVHTEKSDANAQMAWIQSTWKQQYITVENGNIALTDKRVLHQLRKADKDISVNAVRRLESHFMYAIKAVDENRFLFLNGDLGSGTASNIEYWEYFKFVIVDGSNSVEPIIVIRSWHFGNYLRVSGEGDICAQRFFDREERFRIGFEGDASNMQDEYEVWIQSEQFGYYLTVENGHFATSRDRHTVNLKKLDRDRKINVVGRLSQHSVYRIKRDGKTMRQSALYGDATVRAAHSYALDRYRFILFDGTDSNNPQVAIASLGATDSPRYYLFTFNRNGKVRGSMSFMNTDQARFRVRFLNHPENSDVLQFATIQSVHTGKYLSLKSSSPWFVDMEAHVFLERA